MYAFMSTSRLTRLGLSKSEIRSALTCCLRRIARGRYVVSHVCTDSRHRGLWESIESGTSDQFAEVGDMRDEVELLKVLIRARAEHVATGEVGDHARPGREVFSHLSASLVHGLPISHLVEHRVEVTRPAVSRTYPNLRVRRREIPRPQVTRVGVYRVTTLERTLIDVARDHPLDVAVPMLDHALHGGKTNLEFIESALESCSEVVGVRRVRTALEVSDWRSESVAESICAVRFFEHGIPGFEPQVSLFDDAGIFLGRVDFCHRASKTIVEVDGLGKYYLGSGVPRKELEKERQREAGLKSAGYRVVRLSWKQLFRSSAFRQILELTASRVA